MNNCDQYLIKPLRYLNSGAAEERQLEDLGAHLESGADYRFRLDADKAVSKLLGRSRPLYSAPSALRNRVSAILRAGNPEVPEHARYSKRRCE